MNEAAPKIEVFKPFGEAFELTKKILLQPFDIKKWCLIGFAAFLAGHFGGGFNFPLPFGNFRATRTQQNLPHFTVEQWRPWLPLIIFGFIVFILVFIVIVTWLKARGNFIFTDCIVRNRGAIAEPWREYRKEGNSYFKFQLAIMFASIVVFTAVALTLFFAGWVIRGSRHSNLVGLPIFMVLLFVLWIAFGILINVIMYFMAPVMYRQRCLAMDAFREVLRLLATNPTPFVLFCLFGLVLLLAMIVRDRQLCYLLRGKSSVCRHGDFAAGLRLCAGIRAAVSTAVRSRLRRLGDIAAARIPADFTGVAGVRSALTLRSFPRIFGTRSARCD